MVLNIERPCNWFLHCWVRAIHLSSGFLLAGNSYHPVCRQVSHTMLPSMRTAVALATASPQHLPSFKLLKPQKCLHPIFPYERDACKTKAGACSRHGDACATFFGTSAMPAKHKQVPAADMAMPAPQFLGTSAMPAKQKQMPAADMAMPAPQFFQYARDAFPLPVFCNRRLPFSASPPKSKFPAGLEKRQW